ncbi:MAG: polysaccharide biosynthesis tyrosine autokinase [Calothrix sp. MO_192.B10]|nr:polysaccharide biosynthesis tyrosine autokinase [Calothrix sp. MO_192.B10]
MPHTNSNTQVNPAMEKEPGYGQLFAVLIRRLPWLLAIFITTVGIAGIITIFTKPTYKSSMQILVESNYRGRDQKEGFGKQKEFTDAYFVVDTVTQLNLMRTSGLIQKAIEQLQADYPDMSFQKMQRSFVLTQIRDKEDNVATKIFLAEYTDQDPVKTQKVLEAVRQVYLDYNKKQQEERLKKGLKVIRDQLKQVKNEVRIAEANLQKFRRSKNLINPESQAQALEQALNKIQQERRSTRSQYEEAIARYNSLQEQLKRTPQNALISSRLSQSTRYQKLLNEIQKTELAIAQERLRFTDGTPQVRKLIEQRNSQVRLLQKEVSRTLGGATTTTSNLNILQKGQLGEIDLNLAKELVETQTNILALRARDQGLIKKEESLRTTIKQFPTILAEYSRLSPQVKLSRERLQQLLKAEQELRQELSKGGFDWQVVEEPLLGMKIGPNLRQNLLLGGVVGLMLGSITAFVRDASDDSVRTTAEIESRISLPVLGAIPKLSLNQSPDSLVQLPGGKSSETASQTIQVLQSTPRWESLDLLYKNIELMSLDSKFKSLMITAAIEDRGKSTMALGLAMSAARLHKKVLLIDANLRAPNLHKQLELPNEQGLSTLLTTEVTSANQISVPSSGSSYIDILTAGPIPTDPAHLLSSPRMVQLMAEFEETYDLVIVDASPVLGLVDALLTASCCQSVVMIASMGKVSRTQLAQATEILNRLNLIGVVANEASNSNYSYVPYNQRNQLKLQPVIEE